MRRKLLSAFGVLVMLLSIGYVARPVGHVALYDANLVRLAETGLEGYCAGIVFWSSQGTGDAAAAADCRATTTGKSTKVDVSTVERPFCRAIVESGWEGDVATCLDIMAGAKYWPTYDGSITDQWNRARPYPRSELQGIGEPDGSRTGGRSGASRDGNPIYRVP